MAGTVRVSVEGAELATGWILAEGGRIVFEEAPVRAPASRAGFRFDVPVRFAEDRLGISRATFRAGELSSVPLIEIREVAA